MAAKPVPPRPAPRLYLATPEVDDPSQLAASLPDLLAAADVAAVLMRLKPTDQRTMISRVKTLAPMVQNAGAALLLDGHVELVARAGADGAHVTGLAALEDALPSLKPDRIAGVGGLATRHDSMAAGEVGADYVLFGEPDSNGQRPSTEAIAERLQWWDELFEPPCVGFAVSREEAAEFAAAGADFVLVGDFIWADPRGAKAALIDAAQAISQAHTAFVRQPSGPGTGITPDMKRLRSISMLTGLLMAATGASAQISLTPPGEAAACGCEERAAPKEAPKRREAAAPAAKKRQAPTGRAAPIPFAQPSTIPNVDLVYGAYQRGLYKTAFDLATTRAQFNGDPEGDDDAGRTLRQRARHQARLCRRPPNGISAPPTPATAKACSRSP